MSIISYQPVRVRNRATNAVTTISIAHPLYIRACQHLRSLRAVNELVRELALVCVPAPDEMLSQQVAGALELHIAGLDAALGR